MRPTLLVLMLALVFALAAVGTHPVDAPAASAVPIVLTETDTLTVPEGFGGISIQARNGDVGVRLIGGPFAAADDSIPLHQNQWLNLDLYARLRVFPTAVMSGLAVYVAAGDSVVGIYW